MIRGSRHRGVVMDKQRPIEFGLNRQSGPGGAAVRVLFTFIIIIILVGQLWWFQLKPPPRIWTTTTMRT